MRALVTFLLLLGCIQFAKADWVSSKGTGCNVICGNASSQALTSGNYKDGSPFYVCRANAQGEGARAGYNLVIKSGPATAPACQQSPNPAPAGGGVTMTVAAGLGGVQGPLCPLFLETSSESMSHRGWQQPLHGTLTFDTAYRYQPQADYLGPDQFAVDYVLLPFQQQRHLDVRVNVIDPASTATADAPQGKSRCVVGWGGKELGLSRFDCLCETQ